MAHVLYARRRWLMGAAGVSLIAAAPALASPQSPTGKKSAESVPVTATEDIDFTVGGIRNCAAPFQFEGSVTLIAILARAEAKSNSG